MHFHQTIPTNRNKLSVRTKAPSQKTPAKKEDFSYTYTPREYHYTLYYYDQSGNLVQTVPPKGVQPLSNSQVDLVKNGSAVHPAHTLPTRYRYNSRDQLTGQESPDAGESSFWYNRTGQVRMSQDARQATEDAYSYTRYDRQGRVTETGELLSTVSIDTLKGKINDPAFPDPFMAAITSHPPFIDSIAWTPYGKVPGTEPECGQGIF